MMGTADNKDIMDYVNMDIADHKDIMDHVNHACLCSPFVLPCSCFGSREVSRKGRLTTLKL